MNLSPRLASLFRLTPSLLGLAVAGAMLVSASAQTSGDQRPPNIIYILADDLGYGDVGCYGQEKIRTPHLDQMAREGLRFTQHYSGSAVCAPSRSALMTGQHTGHTPVRGNKEYRPEGQHPMPAAAVTVAEVLREAGYATAAFGKWGLGFIGTEGEPSNQGFEHFFGYNCQRWAHRYYPPYLWENDKQVFLRGNDTYHKVTYGPDIIHERALAYLKNRKDDKPFFLFLPYIAPHAELQAPDDEILKSYRGQWPEKPFAGAIPDKRGGSPVYGAEDWSTGGYAPEPEPRAVFAAMVTRLDRQVGEIIKAVDELGLAENTLIIFSSDNGPHIEGGADPEFFNSNGPLRGFKRDMYEGGIRVPTIARWKGRVPAGATTDHVSAFWDMLPTFAELAKAKTPANLDGISIVPTLLGQPGQKQHEYLYWEFAERPAQAVRQGNWKAVRTMKANGKLDPVQLFDLSKDLGETQDLAAQHPDVVAKMVGIMDQAHQRSALFPLPNEK